tara:strand:+ start:135 stop:923 length:789 start_codon:yes stop_codon:yes gene_type:complete
MSLFDDSRLSIDKLKGNIDQGARANRFLVNIMCPQLGISDFGIRCTDCQIPGRQLVTSDFSTYGPEVKYPYNVSNDGQEITFTFVCDSTFADRFIIDAWMSSIFTGAVRYQTKSETIENEGTPEEVRREETHEHIAVKEFASSAHPMWGYYNDYIGTIEIQQITRSDKTSLIHKLYEAYPISMNPIALSSASGDEIMKFECTFAYRTWDSLYKAPNPVSGINKGRRIVDTLLDLKNLRKGGNKSNDSLQRFSDRLAKLDGII